MKLLYGNPVARSISLRLLSVHALSSLLQINCSVRTMGDRTKWYWTKWHGQNGTAKW